MSVMFDPEAAIYPFPPKPTPLSVDEKQFYREKIKRLLKARDAVMVAHYYTDPEIQHWLKKPEDAFPTRWRWRDLARNILPPRCWLLASVLWARRLKFSARKKPS